MDKGFHVEDRAEGLPVEIRVTAGHLDFRQRLLQIRNQILDVLDSHR